MPCLLDSIRALGSSWFKAQVYIISIWSLHTSQACAVYLLCSGGDQGWIGDQGVPRLVPSGWSQQGICLQVLRHGLRQDGEQDWYRWPSQAWGKFEQAYRDVAEYLGGSYGCLEVPYGYLEVLVLWWGLDLQLSPITEIWSSCDLGCPLLETYGPSEPLSNFLGMTIINFLFLFFFEGFQ